MSSKLAHERALELLPWLVNDTLQGTEREELERHVRDCLVCRAELRAQRELEAVVQTQPTLDWSVERGFDALLERIDSDKHGAKASRRRWIALLFHPALFVGATATAAAAVAIALWIGRAGPALVAPETFTTLSEPSSNTAVLVDVIFSPGVSETQMRDLLQGLDATIVAGPSELGRYTIRATIDIAGSRDIDTLLNRLREDARVRFAGRSFELGETGGTQ